jgi:uncharacterized alpha-E superfamily protein
MLPLVLDLLLLDESNPRSVSFQLAALSRHIDTLPQSGEGSGRNEEQRMALSLLSQIRLADTATLDKTEADGTRPALQQLLSGQATTLELLSDVIGRRYFNLTEKDAKWSRVYSRAEP